MFTKSQKTCSVVLFLFQCSGLGSGHIDDANNVRLVRKLFFTSDRWAHSCSLVACSGAVSPPPPQWPTIQHSPLVTTDWSGLHGCTETLLAHTGTRPALQIPPLQQDRQDPRHGVPWVAEPWTTVSPFNLFVLEFLSRLSLNNTPWCAVHDGIVTSNPKNIVLYLTLWVVEFQFKRNVLLSFKYLISDRSGLFEFLKMHALTVQLLTLLVGLTIKLALAKRNDQISCCLVVSYYHPGITSNGCGGGGDTARSKLLQHVQVFSCVFTYCT